GAGLKSLVPASVGRDDVREIHAGSQALCVPAHTHEAQSGLVLLAVLVAEKAGGFCISHPLSHEDSLKRDIGRLPLKMSHEACEWPALLMENAAFHHLPQHGGVRLDNGEPDRAASAAFKARGDGAIRLVRRRGKNGAPRCFGAETIALAALALR